jgi:K+-transporting ATPase A subunit
MPGDNVVLATVIVTERDQSEYAKNKDVGEVLQLYNGTIPAFVQCSTGFSRCWCLVRGHAW